LIQIDTRPDVRFPLRRELGSARWAEIGGRVLACGRLREIGRVLGNRDHRPEGAKLLRCGFGALQQVLGAGFPQEHGLVHEWTLMERGMRINRELDSCGPCGVDAEWLQGACGVKPGSRKEWGGGADARIRSGSRRTCADWQSERTGSQFGRSRERFDDPPSLISYGGTS